MARLWHTNIVILEICILLIFVSLFMKESEAAGVKENTRGGKLFPVFQVVTFHNSVCTGSATRNGTCYTAAECTAKSGTSAGTCASGYGVCCVFLLSCGGTSSQNCTYLVQSSITKATTNDPCTYTICKCNPNICRIRLDFTTFQIAGPQTGTTITTADAVALSAAQLAAQLQAATTNGGGIGDCTTDTFSLTSPGAAGSPIICGYNTGQHMIVDASNTCSTASFFLGNTGDTRQWDIKVTQYACGDPNGGPPGCLQYFTANSGTVSSYNFPTNSATVSSTATHLSSQCYSICFRQNAGNNCLCFSTAITNPTIVGGVVTPNPSSMQTSFGLSNPAFLPNAANGENAMARNELNTNCISDYLLIPVAMAPGTVPSSRFCGRVFCNNPGTTTTGNTVCTKTVPFQIQFKTDQNEVTGLTQFKGMLLTTDNEQFEAPGGIVGFSLSYIETATC